MEKTVKVIVMDNKIAKTFEAFNSLSSELKEIIVGKDEQIDKTLACLLAKGHILLEDMPGVGKTTLASALASAIRGSFSRIQFTSDLLPFDIIGSKIYRRQTEIFEFKKPYRLPICFENFERVVHYYIKKQLGSFGAAVGLS